MSSLPVPDADTPASIGPVGQDMDAAVRLTREAVFHRPWISDRGPEIADRFERALRTRSAAGALLYLHGAPAGIAVWSPPGPLGLALDLWHVVPSRATPDRFRWFLEAIRRDHGPVVFVPGEISGLTPEEEGRLMVGLGYGRFGRSELRRPPNAPLPALDVPAGCSIRPLTPDDEVPLFELHARAYHDRFDRFLFLEDLDERTDAQHLMNNFFRGRWGDWSPAGTQGIERSGRLLGAALTVRRSPGALIVDVMVEPAVQGEGIGRALLAGTVRSLVARGEQPIILNVTEGNGRALRLYARLGFVRTLGPTRDWYDRSRIAIAPEPD